MIGFEIGASEFETDIWPHRPDFICGGAISIFQFSEERPSKTKDTLTFIVPIKSRSVEGYRLFGCNIRCCITIPHVAAILD